ncbi:Ionotropic receptor 589 [Blattella germanica]|nr:Ionotropic receptor 589 [Blattella germanica]
MDRAINIKQFLSPLATALILLLIAQTLVDSNFVEEDYEPEDITFKVKCIENIMERNFAPNKSLLFVSVAENQKLTTSLLKNINEAIHCPILVHRSKRNVKLSHMSDQKFGNCLIVKETAKYIDGQLPRLMKLKNWNNQANFLIFITEPTKNANKTAFSILETFWNDAKVLNVVVMLVVDQQFELYSWFPYRSSTICGDVTEVFLVGKFPFYGGKCVTEEYELYPYKIPKKFHSCPIIIATYSDYIGDNIELKYVKLLLESALNFTVHVVEELKENMYIGIDWMMRKIILDQADIALKGMPLLHRLYKMADPSLPYYETTYQWYVPCAKPLSRVHSVSRIFALSLWLCICLSLLVFAAAIWVLSRFSDEPSAYYKLPTLFCNIWAVVLGIGASQMPTTTRLRFVFVTLVWYCFAISTVFQTYFTSYLVNPGFGTQISSLEELLNSKMAYGFRPEIINFIQDLPQPSYRDIIRGYEKCNSSEYCIGKIEQTEAFAAVIESWYVDRILNTENYQSVCIMNKFETFSVLITSYFMKGSYFTDVFNKYIQMCIQSGLLGIVQAERDKTKQHYTYLNEQDSEDEVFIFSLSHLLVAFSCLFLGSGLGILILCVEIIYFRFQQTKINPPLA